MPNTDISFNAEVAKKYFEALKSIESLVSDNDKSQTDYLAIIAKMPDVFTTTDNEFLSKYKNNNVFLHLVGNGDELERYKL